jgi:hypothetical protein
MFLPPPTHTISASPKSKSKSKSKLNFHFHLPHHRSFFRRLTNPYLLLALLLTLAIVSFSALRAYSTVSADHFAVWPPKDFSVASSHLDDLEEVVGLARASTEKEPVYANGMKVDEAGDVVRHEVKEDEKVGRLRIVWRG